MSPLQVTAMLVLWRSGHFDTHDIAHVLQIREPEVCKALRIVSDRERGAQFAVIEGGRA